MNPNYQDVGPINPSNPQNEVSPRVMRTHNTFPMSYQHALTARFADITPFFVFDAEANDKVPFSSFHELRSYTLSSQFLDKLSMHKTYFSVPYKAIMPNTWDLYYTPPLKGDDVPADVAPSISNLLSLCNSILTTKFRQVNNASEELTLITQNLRVYFLIEALFSDASIMSLFGCKLSKYFRYIDDTEDTMPHGAFEKFSNDFLNSFRDFITYENALNDVYITFATDDNSVDFKYYINRTDVVYFRSLLEWLRSHPDFFVSGVPEDVSKIWSPDLLVDNLQGFRIDTTEIPISFFRPVAYQLSYVHFLVNDKVDDIFSASLYRDMMLGLVGQILDSTGFGIEGLFFTYNGNKVPYDFCSGKFIELSLSDISSSIDSDFSPHYVYLMELLSIRKSLKYGDYFTGSRVAPLAVGDVTAPVVGNGVSAIELTKKTLAQRFLNAVNKTGRKLSDYMKEIRGSEIMPNPDDPKFLARDTSAVGTMEVENTAENQGNVVSLLRAEQSKYAFEAGIDSPSIIVGLVEFSIPRMYSKTIDRFFFKKERDDMFNPYFQNIGDQEIFVAEKTRGGMTPFAYTLRHMEYKQRYNVASGGVVDYLPSWFFIADNKDAEDTTDIRNISPDFIRSHNTEFDRFYSSLTGVTLSSYFHFILRFVNECNPNRNMEYSPTIL